MTKKEKITFKNILFALIPSLSLILLPPLFSMLILRNLGAIVALILGSGGGGKFDFVEIFSQTKDAIIAPHLIFPIIIGAIFFITSLFLLARIKSRVISILLHILVLTVLFTLSFVLALLLSQVNGIRFCDLLAKLLPLIDKL